MRVVSGTAKGRQLKSVPGTITRPTSDKVKEAIFSSIGPYFNGGWALDLFAGTGALGIEALSRGMERAVFIDMDRKCMDVIKQNLETTGLANKAEIYRNEASKALKALAKRKVKFDLVFLDPPYKFKFMDEHMQFIAVNRLVSAEALIVVEHEATYNYGPRIGVFIMDNYAVYGDTAVTTYRIAPDYILSEGDEPHEQ